MCVIIEIKKGSQFPEKNLRNATMNNKDGFGLIILDDNKKVKVERFITESGNDPDHVQEVLKSYEDKDVILHLRHNTKGTTTKDNTHPFMTLSDNKNSVYMMHNGTMYEYSNKFGEGKDEVRSDTQLFNEFVLRPYLKSLKPTNGKIILDTESNKFILSKLIPNNNRVVIVNNGQEPLYLGDWVEYTTLDGQLFTVSNTSYFNSPTARGTSYNYSGYNHHGSVYDSEWFNDRGTSSKKANGGKEVMVVETPKEKAAPTNGGKSIIPFPPRNNTPGVDCISEIEEYLKFDDNGMVLSNEIKTLLNSTSKYLSYSDIRNMAFMETDELMSFMVDDDGQPVNYTNLIDVAEIAICTAMEFLDKCDAVDKANETIKKLEDKLNKASNRIATLTKTTEKVG